MAINWRRAMTQDPAYTAPPQYRRAGDRSGVANIGGEPSWRGRRQPGFEAANTRAPAGTGFGQAVQGTAGNVRDWFGGLGLGSLARRGLGSIGQNIEDHRALNEYYAGQPGAKNQAFWREAGYNYGLPGVDEFGISTERPSARQFGKTDTGTSWGQAKKYFDKAGISDKNLENFFNPESKFYGREGYLSGQARDQDAFKTGMSFIKNAKATANLRKRLESQQAVGDPFASGIAEEGGGGPSYPTGPISAIDYGDPNLDDILYGEPTGEPTGEPEDIFGNLPEPGIYGRPDWDDLDGIYDFERQRQKAAFSPKLLAEDRVHPTIPLGHRTFTASPIEVDYPFGLDDDISPLPLGSNAALAARGYWEPNITPIFEDDEELTPTQLYNPRVR